jgi:hypothetical protein
MLHQYNLSTWTVGCLSSCNMGWQFVCKGIVVVTERCMSIHQDSVIVLLRVVEHLVSSKQQPMWGFAGVCG